ncbi:UNVERIFIED_CONTAM: hypothetical protein Slati_0552500 [Sesamum latifolium]|uniref:Uncharacterized protein n=1 Tax=Sesamum latifolium TaxID=2727402 RepID=A0AAW2XYX6_9LAMI
MAQKRDKEETELKVPENLPICTPPQTLPSPHPQLPASRSPETSDPKQSGACDPRISSAASPDKPDLVAPMESRGGSLKRPREVTRCSGSGCRKRIGLMGFRCRCGTCSVRSTDTQIGTTAATITRRLGGRRLRGRIPWLGLRSSSRFEENSRGAEGIEDLWGFRIVGVRLG